MIRNITHGTALSCLVVTCLSLPVAVADEPAKGRTIEEVIVTATKRSESIQDVALSISALGQDQIEKEGIESFSDYSAGVPGLNFNNVEENRSTFTVRGISTSTVPKNSQDTVAVYINDIVLQDLFANTATPDLALADVNRIEVLRGPQGTLFGAGALAGAVRIITNKPRPNEFEASVTATYQQMSGGATQQRYDAMVNIPLLRERAGLRLVAFKKDNEGWVRNIGLDRDPSNNSESWGGRLGLTFDATEKLNFELQGLIERSYPEDRFVIDPTLGDPGDGDYVRSTTRPDITEVEMDFLTLVVNYAMPWADLYSSTNYSDRTVDYRYDASNSVNTGVPLLQELLQELLVPQLALGVQVLDHGINWVQEIRLSSTAESNWRWTAGVFHFEREVRDSEIHIPSAIAERGLFDAEIQIPGRASAVFGEIEWDFLPWSVALGIRAERAEATYSEQTSGVLNIGPENPTGTSDTTRETDPQESVTPKLNITWEPQDDLMFYLQIAKGYRAGHVNPALPVESPREYDPDSLWNYEIGWKTHLFDRRLKLNGAVFYIDWEDLQVDLLTETIEFNFITNAGSAISRGVELEWSAALQSWLGLSGSLSYIDAEIDDIPPDAAEATGAKVGDQLPGGAEWSSSLALNFYFPVGPLDGFAQISHAYVGESVATFPDNPSNNGRPVEQGDYHVYNFNAGISAERWDLYLNAKNLENATPTVAVLPVDSDQRLITLPPRSVALKLTLRF